MNETNVSKASIWWDWIAEHIPMPTTSYPVTINTIQTQQQQNNCEKLKRNKKKYEANDKWRESTDKKSTCQESRYWSIYSGGGSSNMTTMMMDRRIDNSLRSRRFSKETINSKKKRKWKDCKAKKKKKMHELTHRLRREQQNINMKNKNVKYFCIVPMQIVRLVHLNGMKKIAYFFTEIDSLALLRLHAQPSLIIRFSFYCCIENIHLKVYKTRSSLFLAFFFL